MEALRVMQDSIDAYLKVSKLLYKDLVRYHSRTGISLACN